MNNVLDKKLKNKYIVLHDDCNQDEQKRQVRGTYGR